MPKRSAKPKLGRLEKLDPTDYWQAQADFQQWLTDEETLELLGESVGLSFSLVEDRSAEGYTLLSQDDSELVTLVAAHLDRPGAADLGRLLTWAAGERVAQVLWVAPEFSAETVIALDWLNQTSDVTFLGLTVELWRIGKAAMAANFIPSCGAVETGDDEDAAAGRDDVGEAVESEPEPEPLTELQQENLDFWGGLCDRMDRQGSLVKPGSPSTEATMGFAIARAGFRLNVILDRDHRSLYTELLLSGVDAQPHFHLLAQERGAIADDIGLPLIWDGAGDQACIVACTLADVDLANRDNWPTYYAWFCDCLERFYEAFFDRIKRVDAAAYQPLPRSRREAPTETLILPAPPRR
ncbi:MAG TPA: DUF4268 domain-containing protein [Nodosilinea sp.]|nr:DUF4268 domain-containing protein [Nodosilinea sp.]